MRLKVMLPTGILLDQEAVKLTAEALNGGFCLLPNHIDFVAALAPGILTAATPDRADILLAVDGGVLVKCGQEVLVSARRAVRGEKLGALQRTVEEDFKKLDDEEKTVRSAMARIEAGFVRRFLEVQAHG